MHAIRTTRSARLGLRRATLLGLLAIAAVTPAIGWGDANAADETSDVVDATTVQDRVEADDSMKS
jgi:hypothetical protein